MSSTNAQYKHFAVRTNKQIDELSGLEQQRTGCQNENINEQRAVKVDGSGSGKVLFVIRSRIVCELETIRKD